MAEIVSRQVAAMAAGLTGFAKPLTNLVFAKKRVITITAPTTQVIAQNDTIASGIALPVGTRFGLSNWVSHQAQGTSVTLDVGIRNFATKVAIDADGLGALVAVAAAGITQFATGALVAAGADYVTTEVSEIYATYIAANPTDNAQMRLDIEVLLPD